MRDRLIEIIQKSVGGCARHWAEIIADGLIANGATVMPEKVYWFNMGGKFVEAKVHNEKFIAEIDGGLAYDIPHEEIGKTVFLTKEEAERELERRRNEAD